MKLENSNSTKCKQKRRIIAIAAGGTGGHLFPALVVAKRMLEEGYKVIFFSDKRAMRFLKDDNPIFTFDTFKVVMLESQNAPRWQQFFMIIKDMWKCRIIFTERASLCIGFGGLISFPAILFSILTFKKTIIYDPNSVFGLANRLLAPFVNLILLGFQNPARVNKFYKRKCIFIGGIVRDEIKSLVKGVMVESYLVEGNQPISDHQVYGQSITDACLGWEDTKRLILEVADLVD